VPSETFFHKQFAFFESHVFFQFENITKSLGLDPSEKSTDQSTSKGLGSFIGYAVAKKFLDDEFNQVKQNVYFHRFFTIAR
jgi:hypothetical protein